MGSQPWVLVGKINDKFIGFVFSVQTFPTYHIVQDQLIFFKFIYFDGGFFILFIYILNLFIFKIYLF